MLQVINKEHTSGRILQALGRWLHDSSHAALSGQSCSLYPRPLYWTTILQDNPRINEINRPKHIKLSCKTTSVCINTSFNLNGHRNITFAYLFKAAKRLSGVFIETPPLDHLTCGTFQVPPSINDFGLSSPGLPVAPGNFASVNDTEPKLCVISWNFLQLLWFLLMWIAQFKWYTCWLVLANHANWLLKLIQMQRQ